MIEIDPIFGHLMSTLYDDYAHAHLWSVDEHAEKVLQTLKEWDVKLAIISNFDERLVRTEDKQLLFEKQISYNVFSTVSWMSSSCRPISLRRPRW